MRKLISVFVFSLLITILELNNFAFASAAVLTTENETAATTSAPAAKDFGLGTSGGNEALNNIAAESLSFLSKTGEFFSRVPDKIWSGINHFSNLSVNINVSPVDFLTQWLKQIIADIGSAIFNISALFGLAMGNVATWLGEILIVLAVLLILITGGFILMKVLKISLIRNFFVVGFIGAAIIIGIFLGTRYVITSLWTNFSNYQTNNQPTAETDATAVENSIVEQNIVADADKSEQGWLAKIISKFSTKTSTLSGQKTVTPAGINLQTDPNNCGQVGNVCSFADCGPYADVYGCYKGACRVCPTSCTTTGVCKNQVAACYKDKKTNVQSCRYISGTPKLTSFTVTPINSGESFQVSWNVAAGSLKNLSGFELLRRPEKGNWQEVKPVQYLKATFRSYIDQPPGCGTYWYSLHIGNASGNAQGTESTSGLAPVKVQKPCRAPKISSFTSTTGNNGKEFTFNWSMAVVEEQLIDHFEIWRQAEGESWQQAGINAAKNLRSFTDSPENPSKYQYGLHVVSADFKNYWDETELGLKTLAVERPLELNMNSYLNFTEGAYAAFYDGGGIVNKRDIVFNGEIGTLTKQGGFDVNQNILMGFGNYKYYNRGNSETEKVFTMMPYTSLGGHPLWLMGIAENTYGEQGGGQQWLSNENMQYYFKHLIEFNNPQSPINFANNGYYQRSRTGGLPYTDTYFPTGMQSFRIDKQKLTSKWRHGDRYFLEWQGLPYFLGANYPSLNSGFVEAITWTANDYLNYVNSAYAYMRKNNNDQPIGTEGRICTPSTDFFDAIGRYTNLPFCPSTALLSS